MVSMDDLLKMMMANAPDPNEPLPESNRKGTIYGVTVPLLVRFTISRPSTLKLTSTIVIMLDRSYPTAMGTFQDRARSWVG